MKVKREKENKKETLIVTGSFIDLVKASVKGNPKPKRRIGKKEKVKKIKK